MTWLVWRRLRAPLAVALGLVVLVGLAAVVGRFAAVAIAADRGLLPCLRAVQTGICATDVWFGYQRGVFTFQSLLTLALIALPGVAGSLAGAGLFGADLARGTHVFALSQSIGRVRWWATGLLVAGLPVALAVAAVLPVAEWALNPFGNLTYGGPLDPARFLSSGVVPVGYSVLAFTTAAGAGLLLRSSVGALGVGAAVQLAVLAVTSLVLRPRYLPPETTTVPLLAAGRGDVVWDVPADALGLEYGYLDARGQELPQNATFLYSCGNESFSDCLRANGISALVTSYQPASRYWPFQAIESGLLLALAAGALGAGLWGLRRRVH